MATASTHPALIALEVRGRSVLPFFVWVIVFRLDYTRYIELVLNKKGIGDEKSPTSRLVFIRP